MADSSILQTVFGEKCRSWYKAGKEDGRVVAIWPGEKETSFDTNPDLIISLNTINSGSSLHAIRALEHPRWEDYNYEHLDRGIKNRLYWLGDGSTYNEKFMVGDRAWYLNDDQIDIPPGVFD